jgi:hypothetical protein
MHLFEKELLVSKEEIEFELRGFKELDWDNLLLNPRRLRGSDFLMRWSQGVWSEKRILDAVNSTSKFYAIAYGPSGTAPSDDVRAFELYFERLEAAGIGSIKRPDILFFDKNEKKNIEDFLKDIGGVEELPFLPEKDLKYILEKAIIAIECENSLWVAERMPDFKSELKPQKRLNGKLGLKKSAVLPTVIIKEEDRAPLNYWESKNKVPIHIWHVFFDRAFGIALKDAENLFKKGLIEPTIQTFQAPGGATTKKAIYKIYYHYAYELGIATEAPTLVPDFIQDKNGHILPYVKFDGGSLKLTDTAKKYLETLLK